MTPAFKVQIGSSVSNEGWNTECGVIQLTITDDNVVLKSIRVNRGTAQKWRASVTEPCQPNINSVMWLRSNM